MRGKDIRRVPRQLCAQQLADVGRTTNLYRSLASLSLITSCSSKTVLIFIKPKGRSNSIVSVVLLHIGVEKMYPISRFYNRSDRQPTGLSAFIHSGDNYVIKLIIRRIS